MKWNSPIFFLSFVDIVAICSVAFWHIFKLTAPELLEHKYVLAIHMNT